MNIREVLVHPDLYVCDDADGGKGCDKITSDVSITMLNATT